MRTTSMSLEKKHIPASIFLILYTALSAVPLFFALLNAFKPRDEILMRPLALNFKTLTLEGIINSFNLMNYMQALMNNIIVLVLSLVIMIVFGSLMGFAVAVVGSRILNISYVISILVITIPFQAIMIPIVILMKKIGMLNSFLGMSMVFVATSLPVVVFLYTGFMRSLPKELCEAAIVDGCGILRTYLYIYMPLIKSVTGTIIIIRGVSIWNDLLVCLITTSDASMTTMVYRLYSFVSNKFNRWDIVFGSSLLVSIPIVLVFIFLQKAFVQGVVAGAIKG
jgi:ABC-type sugar transport system, permease component